MPRTSQRQGVGAHGFSVWGVSKSLCENDITGKKGCGALEVMGDCQGNRAGNHWMTKEGPGALWPELSTFSYEHYLLSSS